jgi:hypothetical protein
VTKQLELSSNIDTMEDIGGSGVRVVERHNGEEMPPDFTVSSHQEMILQFF